MSEIILHDNLKPNSLNDLQYMNEKYKVQRFNIGAHNDEVIVLEDPKGKWVPWEAVEDLLKAFLIMKSNDK